MIVVTGFRATVVVILLMTVATFIRNIVLLALFAPRALFRAVGPLFAMACVSLLLRTGKPEDEPGQALTLRRQISLEEYWDTESRLSRSRSSAHLQRGYSAISASWRRAAST